MAADTPNGKFIWFDLVTPDPSAATAFYPPVTGWKTTAWEGTGVPYTMWTKGDDDASGVGGVQPAEGWLPEGTPPHWLCYISTPDVEACVARAVEAGGRVVRPVEEIPNVGTMAVLADPYGARFAPFSPREGGGEGRFAPELGDFSWFELSTSDLDGALDFYTGLFDWEKRETHDMGEMGIYQLWGRQGDELGGMYPAPPQMPGAAWLPYVRVADLDRSVAAVRDGGGQVIVEPMEVPGGDRIAQFLDPAGVHGALHEVKAA